MEANVDLINFNRVEAIILGGLDTTLRVRRSWRQTMRDWSIAHGLDPSRVERRAEDIGPLTMQGRVPDWVWITSLVEAGGGSNGSPLYYQKLLANLRYRRLHDLPLYQGVKHLLYYLDDHGYRVAVLSDVSHLSCGAVERRLQPVTITLASCETRLHKGTDPVAALRTAAQRLRSRPEVVLVVDDDSWLCQAAIEAGMQSIVVGHHEGTWYTSLSGDPGLAPSVRELIRQRIGYLPRIEELSYYL